MLINSIDSPIEQRHTGKGNPNAIVQFGSPLNARQNNILLILSTYDSRLTIPKKTVNMADLSALTAYTGDEFALFTKGNERLVIRGNPHQVNVSAAAAAEMGSQGYRWSGHTHPGTDSLSLMASKGDYAILMCFGQEQSVIYNSTGNYWIFRKE